jgi:hypothetical protein
LRRSTTGRARADHQHIALVSEADHAGTIRPPPRRVKRVEYVGPALAGPDRRMGAGTAEAAPYFGTAKAVPYCGALL